MKSLLPYAALTIGGLGLLCIILSIFVSSFCYISLGLFALASILVVVCIFKGACQVNRQSNQSQA
jgi:hypothetical protein